MDGVHTANLSRHMRRGVGVDSKNNVWTGVYGAPGYAFRVGRGTNYGSKCLTTVINVRAVRPAKSIVPIATT